MFAIQVEMFHKFYRSKWNWFWFGIHCKTKPFESAVSQLYFLLWAILEHSTQYNDNKQCFIVTWINISDALLHPVQWRVEMCSFTCNEKVNLRVYLESVDAKYGIANYGFKLSRPFKIFWNNQWGCICYQKNWASFWFSNMYLILQWDLYFLSYSDLKWSRDFLDTWPVPELEGH